MNSARNLVLVGPMGAGKTSIGRRLAERLGLRFVDADREIEQRTGASVEEQLRRLARDRSRPLLQRPDRAAVLQRLAETRAPLYAQVAHLRIDTDHLTSTESAARLQRLLAEHGVAHSSGAGNATDPAADQA